MHWSRYPLMLDCSWETTESKLIRVEIVSDLPLKISNCETVSAEMADQPKKGYSALNLGVWTPADCPLVKLSLWPILKQRAKSQRTGTGICPSILEPKKTNEKVAVLKPRLNSL